MPGSRRVFRRSVDQLPMQKAVWYAAIGAAVRKLRGILGMLGIMDIPNISLTLGHRCAIIDIVDTIDT